jgi:integral membrane protein
MAEDTGIHCRTGSKLLKKRSLMKIENSKKLLHRFRMVGIAEGISFLVLLLIAMPLKYFMDFPMAVKVTGWIHGALFVAFIYFAFEVMGAFNKNFGWFVKAFIAAFVPLGTFIFDRQLKKDAAALAGQ